MALVALAIQIFLSFSHIDLCEFAAGGAQAASLTAAAAAPFGPGKSAPADKSDRPVTCPICALIQLAATATPATPPALPAPVVHAHVRPVAVDQYLLAAAPRLPFQARAPPAA